MSLIGAAIGAAAVAAALTVALTIWLTRELARPPHLRTNYRGEAVIGTLGIALGAGPVTGGLVALADPDADRTALVLLVAPLALGALGLLDDLRGDRSAGGFIGHVRALLRGEVTTGLVKAAVGGAVGLLGAWVLVDGWRVLAGGAVIALAANLANLLDLRPGRALKVWFVAWVALLLAGPPDPVVVGTSAGAGSAAAFLPADLREHGMLGDAGANLAGGTLGVAAVATLGSRSLLICLGVLAGLTALSEVVSFSRVIERVAPLRAADGLGRRR